MGVRRSETCFRCIGQCVFLCPGMALAIASVFNSMPDSERGSLDVMPTVTCVYDVSGSFPFHSTLFSWLQRVGSVTRGVFNREGCVSTTFLFSLVYIARAIVEAFRRYAGCMTFPLLPYLLRRVAERSAWLD